MNRALFTYPVAMRAAEEGGWIAEFPDLPGAITEGEDEEEALTRAVGALETMLMILMEDGREIPLPSEMRGHAVTLSVLTAAKIALYRAMRETGLGKVQLARRLAVPLPEVEKLLDLSRASRMDRVEAALRSLGKTLRIEVRDAA